MQLYRKRGFVFAGPYAMQKQKPALTKAQFEYTDVDQNNCLSLIDVQPTGDVVNKSNTVKAREMPSMSN